MLHPTYIIRTEGDSKEHKGTGAHPAKGGVFIDRNRVQNFKFMFRV